MSGTERCPGCSAPLAGRVNNVHGTVYLECDRCEYVEPVQRRPSPFPDRVYRQARGMYKGKLRTRRVDVPRDGLLRGRKAS